MIKELIKDACKRLTGFKKREYQATIASEYFEGSAGKAERSMGWGRRSVETGLGEAKTGIRCLDNFKGRGRKRTEDKIEGLEEEVDSDFRFSRNRATFLGKLHENSEIDMSFKPDLSKQPNVLKESRKLGETMRKALL